VWEITGAEFTKAELHTAGIISFSELLKLKEKKFAMLLFYMSSQKVGIP